MKVLVSDKIAAEGIEMMRAVAEVDVKTGLKEEEIIPIISDYDAMVVRSQTQVTAKIIAAAKNMQIIGRAGAGVDNINLDAATRHGIIVVNAPDGNTISAAEHAIALMMSLSRHIPQANASLKKNEWRRNDFMGTEVRGKTLGILGLGRIGTEVAKRAKGMQMNIIGFDPFVSTDHAKSIGVEPVTVEEMFKQADYITLHIPKTNETKNIVGEKELSIAKPNLRIINCARGGLIDEAALVKAVKEKRIAGAAIDVYEKEPCTESILFSEENIIVTPHLGASTDEAQTVSATDVARQIVDVLEGRPATFAVNAPIIPAETVLLLQPFLPLCTSVGKMVSQLADGQINQIKVMYNGEIANEDTKALKAAVLGGLLDSISEERVNLVNANLIANQRGLSVVEQSEAACDNYASMLSVELTTSAGTTTVAGSVLHGEPHIVRINDYWLDIVPGNGYFLLAEHLDRPGLIGAAGRITGNADINISYMHLGRLEARGKALMVLALDEALPDAALRQIQALPDVVSAKLVRL